MNVSAQNELVNKGPIAEADGLALAPVYYYRLSVTIWQSGDQSQHTSFAM